MKKIILFISLTAWAFLSVGCSDSPDYSEYSLVGVGNRIPEFTLAQGFQAGEPIDGIGSEDFAGKRGLIVFFTSYCPDCQAIMDRIEAVWNELGSDPNYVIAAISRQDHNETPAAVADFWTERGFSMPYYLDTSRRVYDLFATAIIPRVYVVDAEGTITYMAIEKLGPTASELAAMIRGQ